MHATLTQPSASARNNEESQFRRLLEVIPAGAYTCNADGLITAFNQRAVEVWGREPKLNDPKDRFCGSFKLFSACGSPIGHNQCWMALALQESKGYNEQEIIVERPDGSRRTVLAHANPFFDEAGNLVGAVNILVDITDRKRAEEALREADRRKGEFLAMLAHELRNPLAPLRNGLQVIQLANGDRVVAEHAHTMMERQLGHMVRLIDDLLDLSRIGNGKIDLRKEKIDLVAAVRDAVETSRPLIEATGHNLKLSLPSRPVPVEADRTRLTQVFANLLNNSARYTKPGGQIRLTVEQQGSDAVVKVRDNGVGISAELLPRIFEMFTQGDKSVERSQGGLGIGLSLVRGLVEMHGGSVEAQSDGPEKGSEFVVRMPACPFATRRNQDGDGKESCRACTYRILVVDDNRDSAESLGMLMKLMGHDVRTAFDGLEAVETAAAFRPEVVLLDIGLPKLNGYEACRRIREQPWGKTMVLIAQTGWGQEEDKIRAKEAGFNFHMVKPVDPAALAKLLAGLLLTPA